MIEHLQNVAEKYGIKTEIRGHWHTNKKGNQVEGLELRLSASFDGHRYYISVPEKGLDYGEIKRVNGEIFTTSIRGYSVSRISSVIKPTMQSVNRSGVVESINDAELELLDEMVDLACLYYSWWIHHMSYMIPGLITDGSVQ